MILTQVEFMSTGLTRNMDIFQLGCECCHNTIRVRSSSRIIRSFLSSNNKFLNRIAFLFSKDYEIIENWAIEKEFKKDKVVE